MAPYAPTPPKKKNRKADLRDAECTALFSPLITKLLAATRSGLDIKPTVPSSAIGKTRSGNFIARWPELTLILGGRCPPAAFWKMLVRLEPALEPFASAGNVSRERLIARCEMILENRLIWSTGLGLNSDATRYIDGVVQDALSLLSSKRKTRARAHTTERLSSWRYAWTDLRCCDLCWRLVPTACSQGGFHAHDKKRPASEADRFRFRGHDALCAFHAPSLGTEERARWKREQRNRDPLVSGRSLKPTWHSVTPEAIADSIDDDDAWSKIMTTAFPLTARAYPAAAGRLPGALHVLSGLPAHAVDKLTKAIPDDVVSAGIVILGMLASCEKLLAHDLKSLTSKTARRIGKNIRGAHVRASARPEKTAGPAADQARDHDTSKPQ